jgi:predicted transposase YbfD/YdcC
LPKKTFEKVKESWNDAIIQLKENQKNLLKNCEEIILNKDVVIWEHKTINTGRNRKETRIVRNYLFNVIRKNVSKEWEENIQEFVTVDRIIKRLNTKTKEWEESYEKSFYLSTKKFKAEEYWTIIRWHWWIENRNHYVKDVSMNEDSSRIRKNADIFVKLRSFALNIMRANWVTNIKYEMYENSLNLDIFLKKYKRIL